MNFKEFTSGLFYPALLIIAAFLTSQYFTSFITKAEFSTHEINQTKEITELEAKLDYIIEQQTELKYLMRGINGQHRTND